MLDQATLEERLRDTNLKPTDKPREWIESTIARQQRLHDTGVRRRPSAPTRSAIEAEAQSLGTPRSRAGAANSTRTKVPPRERD